jgi:hypothetical protein
MLEAEKGRILDLSPPRHGRIARSPCKFYFGAPRAIAYDLASPPVTRVRVQCCGDAPMYAPTCARDRQGSIAARVHLRGSAVAHRKHCFAPTAYNRFAVARKRVSPAGVGREWSGAPISIGANSWPRHSKLARYWTGPCLICCKSRKLIFRLPSVYVDGFPGCHFACSARNRLSMNLRCCSGRSCVAAAC